MQLLIVLVINPNSIGYSNVGKYANSQTTLSKYTVYACGLLEQS